MDAVLTYDIGTTAIKTILFDTKGAILAEAGMEYPTIQPKPTWAEQDPDDWWNAVVSTTKDVLNKYENADILAIGLSSQRETVVPLDKDGFKLDNAILWMDRRAKDEANDLASVFGREYLHKLTGMISDSTFTVNKLLWYKNNKPEVLKDAFVFLQPKEYIAYKLTGSFATDYSIASRTMMLDIKNKKWADEIFDYVGISQSKMPDIKYSDEIMGRVTKNTSQILGIKEGVPVVTGGGDRQCEALGAGIFGNRAMESTGTTTNVSMGVDHMPDCLDQRVIVSMHVIRDSYLIEQGMTTSGSINKWFRDNFCKMETMVAKEIGERDYRFIDRELEKSPPGANKLIALPYFMGAKSTRWDPDSRGVFFGLTLDSTKADMGRAILESVGYEIRACLDILESMNINADEIVAMGGGAKSSLWCHIKADITGKKYKIPRVTDSSSLGAMILACKGIGLYDDIKRYSVKLNNIVGEYDALNSNHIYYNQLYEVYSQVYESLAPVFKKLSEI